MKKSLDAGRRRVDARGDDAVERRGHDRARTLIDEHVDVLLHEERISLRPRDDLVHRSVRTTRQKSTHELLGVGDVQRLERDRHRVRASRSPGRSSLEEIGPREAKKKKRRVELVEKLLEQREEWLFRPVQILEDDRSRRRTEPRLEVSRHAEGELTPSCVGRELRLRCVGVGERKRRELARDLSRLDLVEAFHAGDASLDLRPRNIAAIGRRDRGLSADQLLQRPVRDRVSIGQTRRARDRLGRVKAPEELKRDAGLAHPRIAVDRDEMRSPCRRDTPVHVVEQSHL